MQELLTLLHWQLKEKYTVGDGTTMDNLDLDSLEKILSLELGMTNHKCLNLFWLMHFQELKSEKLEVVQLLHSSYKIMGHYGLAEWMILVN